MINKLVEKIKKTNAPIVVGLDPMLTQSHINNPNMTILIQQHILWFQITIHEVL